MGRGVVGVSEGHELLAAGDKGVQVGCEACKKELRKLVRQYSADLSSAQPPRTSRSGCPAVSAFRSFVSSVSRSVPRYPLDSSLSGTQCGIV